MPVTLRKALHIEVFPNPNSGFFTLSFYPGNNFDEKTVVEIRNVLGQIVYHKEHLVVNGWNRETLELDQSIPEGVYILMITIGEKTGNTRMMLTR